MQLPEPTPEHQWLLQLVGDWDFVSECVMGPDQPPSQFNGTQATRALGSLWTLGEMESPGANDEPMRSIITLGFEPTRGKFVGSFVSSCMTYHWLYEGSLDADRRVLTLDAEGPSFAAEGQMAKYQDIVELIDQDTYLFSSQYQDSQGAWVKFMKGTYRRRK